MTRGFAGAAERFVVMEDKAAKRRTNGQPQASLQTSQQQQQHLLRPSFGSTAGAPARAAKDQMSQQPQLLLRPAFGARTAAALPPAEDTNTMEIMCKKCFALIKMRDVSCHDCTVFAPRNLTEKDRAENSIRLLDCKLRKLRAALEDRIQVSSNKMTVMTHLKQLRQHIDTSARWTLRCSEVGAFCETVQQVSLLTATSRTFAPADYVLFKRVEAIVIQKVRELRRSEVSTGPRTSPVNFVRPAEEREVSGATVRSDVGKMNSNYVQKSSETTSTHGFAMQHAPATTDTGNISSATVDLSLKSEDEQRRWFYSLCLPVKLACPDKAKARKILISDLYTRVKADNVPMDSWILWIENQFIPNRELRRSEVPPGPRVPSVNVLRPAAECEVSGVGVSSDVGKMNSKYLQKSSETSSAHAFARQHAPATTDMSIISKADVYAALKSEDEQRRWFYSQCLSVKLACPDKAKARKTLISDLYTRVKADNVPMDSWILWIENQFLLNGGASAAGAGTGGVK